MNTSPNSATKDALRFIDILDRGPITYGQGLALQTRINADVAQGLVPDTMVFLEHSPVVSVGRRGESQDILVPEAVLQSKGIEVYKTDRGGQVTYHGPGQLVVYTMVNLKHSLRQIRNFVEGLEGAFIDYLSEVHGREAWIDPEFPGIWVAEGKVAAVGISVINKVTMHGVALNVNTAMDAFELIVPCGIRHKSPTSLAQMGLGTIALERVAQDLAPRLARRLGYPSWFTDGSVDILAG